MNTENTMPTDPVESAAEDSFGIPYLFPWQRLVIANILDAVNAEIEAKREKAGIAETDDERLYDEDGALRGRQIVLLPTGAGKSLCFQVPTLLLPGPTLVIYPILALMADQERRMTECNLDPAIFRGGQSREEREAQLARLEGRDGKPPARLIIANPEVLAAGKESPDGQTPARRQSLLDRIAARGVSHIAIDEAHCVSEWGDTFRPTYLELGAIIKRLSPPAVTAFTATASPPVLDRIASALFNGSAHLVRGESDRPNILYSVNQCVAKEPALIREVARRKRPMIVFCATRGGVERMAVLLGEFFGRDDVRYYHAGLERSEKTTTEQWFFAHEAGILVATCAYGMGVDKKNIRTVIHRDAPPTVEAYVQEAGRGGRDGEISEAVLLWSPEDRRRAARLRTPPQPKKRPERRNNFQDRPSK